ncbi:MAG: phosphatase [Bacilli bacterium]|jgi:putative hydrolase|nr:phosphatase [Sphaerochaetaceae bacterium]
MLEKIVGDLHCHTIASVHAYNTIFENISRAKELGYKVLAITDHAIAVPASAPIEYFDNLIALPRKYQGITILRGCEANILSGDGEIDMPIETLRKLDIVIASIHTVCYDFKNYKDCTHAYEVVASNPLVNIIGHSGTTQFPFDYEKVVPLFAKAGKIVELNTHSFICRKDAYDNCKRIMSLCKKHDCRIAVNSDAHVITEMGNLDEARKMLEDLDFPEELIINANETNMKTYLDELKLED